VRCTTSADIVDEAARRARDRKSIVAALSASGGKVFGKGGAAELLGLKPTTLASRIRTLNIDRLSLPRAGKD